MKLAFPLWLTFLMLGIAICGCNEPPEHAHSAREDRVPASSERLPRARDWENSIRDAADAAFASLDSAPARSESRVGPQPWPADLPDAWPPLREATVVADTRQSTGDRLLLVNLPGGTGGAIDSVEATLRARGFEVDRPELRKGRRALHVEAPGHEAVLTFFPRKRATRLEILILPRATG